MQILIIIIAVIIAVLGVALIGVVLMQHERAAGLGIAGGMSASQGTYWSKNKGRDKEGQLELFTKVGGGVFLFLTLILSFLIAV